MDYQSNRVDSKRLDQKTGSFKNTMDRWFHLTAWTCLGKISEGQIPVESIRVEVPLLGANLALMMMTMMMMNSN